MKFNPELLDDLTDGLLVLDGEARIRYASKRARQMLGRNEGDLVGNLMIERSVKSASQGYTVLPASIFVRLKPDELGNADEVFASLHKGAEPGEFALLLRNVSEEKLFTSAWSNLLYFVHTSLAGKNTELHIAVERMGAALGNLPPKGPVSTAAEELMFRAINLSSAMDEIVELADFSVTDLLSERQRIVPVDLVQEAIREINRSAARKRLWITKTGHSDPTPPIYGSHGWLRRALVAYLEYLVEGCAPGTGLDVSLRHIGEHVVIAVRSLGSSMDAHSRDNLFIPFSDENLTETQGGERLPHLGIALARSVVMQHGGQVRITASGSMMSLIMELPTALPAHDGTETGIGQAMRYAQEMKELVLSRGNRLANAKTG
jgi:hypothetical protein